MVGDVGNVADKPVSEHPKDVRQWVLEGLAVLWTESGTGWQVDVKKNLLTRSEGDITFGVYLRPSPYRCYTGHVPCFPHWWMQSRRWHDWKTQKGAAFRWRYLFDCSLRALHGPRAAPRLWTFDSPISIDALFQPQKEPDFDGGAPLDELRTNVSPIFNAIFDADAFAELIHSTNLSDWWVTERAEYFVAIGRSDLAQAELIRHPRACSHEKIVELGLSPPGQP